MKVDGHIFIDSKINKRAMRNGWIVMIVVGADCIATSHRGSTLSTSVGLFIYFSRSQRRTAAADQSYSSFSFLVL